MEPSNAPGMYNMPAYVEVPHETGDHSIMIYRDFEMNPDPDPGFLPGGCLPQFPAPHLPIEWTPPIFNDGLHCPWDLPGEVVPF